MKKENWVKKLTGVVVYDVNPSTREAERQVDISESEARLLYTAKVQLCWGNT